MKYNWQCAIGIECWFILLSLVCKCLDPSFWHDEVIYVTLGYLLDPKIKGLMAFNFEHEKFKIAYILLDEMITSAKIKITQLGWCLSFLTIQSRYWSFLFL